MLAQPGLLRKKINPRSISILVAGVYSSRILPWPRDRQNRREIRVRRKKRFAAERARKKDGMVGLVRCVPCAQTSQSRAGRSAAEFVLRRDSVSALVCPLVVSISPVFGFGWRVSFRRNQLLASSARCTRRAARCYYYCCGVGMSIVTILLGCQIMGGDRKVVALERQSCS